MDDGGSDVARVWRAGLDRLVKLAVQGTHPGDDTVDALRRALASQLPLPSADCEPHPGEVAGADPGACSCGPRVWVDGALGIELASLRHGGAALDGITRAVRAGAWVAACPKCKTICVERPR